MYKEIEFFISEHSTTLDTWETESEERGSRVVGSKNELIDVLRNETHIGDRLSCRISGAWLDVCILHAVRDLLHDPPFGIPGRIIDSISVDVSHCVLFEERITPQTNDVRQSLFEKALGAQQTDKRLHIIQHS